MNLCTNGFLNCSDTLGSVIYSATIHTTGNIFISMLFVILIMCAFAMLFSIRLEYTAIIILPLLLGLMAYSKEFIGFGVLILVYLAIVAAGNFFIR
jgi:hypothetical protein